MSNLKRHITFAPKKSHDVNNLKNLRNIGLSAGKIKEDSSNASNIDVESSV